MAGEQKKREGTAKNWCFTSFKIKHIKWDSTLFNYLVYQEEISPETGKHHIQGFCQLISRKRMSQVKTILEDDTVHLEKMHGTPREASDYCKKKDSRAPAGITFEGGELQLTGARNDLKNLMDAVDEGKTYNELVRCEEFVQACAQYPKFVDRAIKQKRLDDGIKEMEKKFENVKLHDWQQELVDYITNYSPADRSVLWFIDEIGNTGKTFLAKYLICFHKAIIMSPARYTDLAYVWAKNPAYEIVIFDCSRTTQKDGNYDPMLGSYSFAEKLKDGWLMSTKYEAEYLTFKSPHVIFFANYRPDLARLSRDRWIISNIENNKLNLEIDSTWTRDTETLNKYNAPMNYNPSSAQKI